MVEIVGVTVIVLFTCAPGNQLVVVAPEISVLLLPAQIVVINAETVYMEAGATAIAIVLESVHPFRSVADTLYAVVLVGVMTDELPVPGPGSHV